MTWCYEVLKNGSLNSSHANYGAPNRAFLGLHTIGAHMSGILVQLAYDHYNRSLDFRLFRSVLP